MKNKKKITYFISSIIIISLALVVIQSSYINNKKERSSKIESSLGSFDNPEIAYKECKAVLFEVSKAINTNEKVK